jgi:hypothetical protein
LLNDIAGARPGCWNSSAPAKAEQDGDWEKHTATKSSPI